MKSLFVRYEFIFNRKNILNSNGEALIQIRMYLNGLNKYYSTGVYVKPSEWNEAKNVPKNPIILRKINTLKQELADFEQDTCRRVGTFILKDFDNFGKAVEPVQKKIEEVSFTQFMITQHNAEKALKQESWRARKLTIDTFIAYKKDVSFEQLNYTLIEGFDFFLHNKRLHINTIANHHKHIKKYILRAIKEEYLNQKSGSYFGFTVKKTGSKSQFLTKEEIERFENIEFEVPNTFSEKVKDMFLFGVYTGLRFSDIYKLKRPHFLEDSDGMILEYQANKTKKHGVKFLDILFFGKPRKIVDKYMPEDDKKTLFKGLTNPKVNKALKTLAKQAKIAKSLCFKDSRDTFATQLINSNLPLTIVQDELQHHNLKQTSKYLHVSGEETKKVMKNLWKQ